MNDVCVVMMWMTVMGVGLSGALAQGAPTTGPVLKDDPKVQAIAAMLPEKPAGMGKPITDRSAWKALAKGESAPGIIQQAERIIGETIPVLPEELYREFSRNGNRSNYEGILFAVRRNLATLVLAECLEDKERFLPKIIEHIDFFCAQPTWVWPAHDRKLANFEQKAIEIDLGAAEMGSMFATIDWLLGARLPGETREKIVDNVRRRVVDPYLAAATGKAGLQVWMKRTNNWNAVCHAGVVAATLTTVDDRDTRAIVVESANRYVQYFLDSFPPDGYCTEGLGYWNYGFGHYILLAETIRQATSGKLDLMERQGVSAIAQFGRRIQIMNGIAPAFADCSIHASPSSQILRYVDARYGSYPARGATELSDHGFFYDIILNAFLDLSTLPRSETNAVLDESPLRSWFSAAGILIARPGKGASCRIGVALKGGNNAEQHNHNDLGSYVVVVDDEAVLLDPGPERYTARTFGPHRYDSKLLNSFGHPVPLVAGKLQRTGAQAEAKIVESKLSNSTDTLVLDLTSAYEAPDLRKLVRTFVYDRRGKGSLTITDEVEFSSPQAFSTAMITQGTVSQSGDGAWKVQGARSALVARIDTSGQPYSMKQEKIEEDSSVKPLRLGIELNDKVTSARITIQLTVP